MCKLDTCLRQMMMGSVRFALTLRIMDHLSGGIYSGAHVPMR